MTIIMTSEVRETWPLLVVSKQCLKYVPSILNWGFIVKTAIRFSFGAVEDIVNSISAGAGGYLLNGKKSVC